jgi:hypothetical protein
LAILGIVLLAPSAWTLVKHRFPHNAENKIGQIAEVNNVDENQEDVDKWLKEARDAARRVHNEDRAKSGTVGNPFKEDLADLQDEMGVRLTGGDLVRVRTGGGKTGGLDNASYVLVRLFEQSGLRGKKGVMRWCPQATVTRDAELAARKFSPLGIVIGRLHPTERSKGIIYEVINGKLEEKDRERSELYRRCDIIFGVKAEFVYDAEIELFSHPDSWALINRIWRVLEDEVTEEKTSFRITLPRNEVKEAIPPQIVSLAKELITKNSQARFKYYSETEKTIDLTLRGKWWLICKLTEEIGGSW